MVIYPNPLRGKAGHTQTPLQPKTEPHAELSQKQAWLRLANCPSACRRSARALLFLPQRTQRYTLAQMANTSNPAALEHRPGGHASLPSSTRRYNYAPHRLPAHTSGPGGWGKGEYPLAPCAIKAWCQERMSPHAFLHMH